MASKYWIKLYHEILDDPKMGRLSDRLFRRAIQCFLLAGDCDKSGEMPTVNDMAWRFRIDPKELENELIELEKQDILQREGDCWVVTNFMVRQMAMSNSERARRWRERNKGTEWAKSLYKGLPAKPGIYMITCKNTGMHYIGATNNIHSRIKQNLYRISKDEHAMSDDVLTFGVESLEVEILELVENETVLSKKEQGWIDKYPKDDLYNKNDSIENRNWIVSDKARIENEKRTVRSQIKNKESDKNKIIDARSDFSDYQKAWEEETGMMITGSSYTKYTKMCKRFIDVGVTPEIFRTAIREQQKSDYAVKRPEGVEEWAVRLVKASSNNGVKQDDRKLVWADDIEDITL